MNPRLKPTDKKLVRTATAAITLLAGLGAVWGSGTAVAKPKRFVLSEPVSTLGPSTTTVPPTTAPPTTTPPSTGPTTTEVRTAATVSVNCAQVGATLAVQCNWLFADLTNVVKILLLRGDGTVGRVLGPFTPATTSMLDGTVKPATIYSFVVIGLDAMGKVLAHSMQAFVAIP